MDHLKVYNRIIDKAKSENRKRRRTYHPEYVYYEKHHILPKCIQGTDEEKNLVLLTGREHYICHKLLTFIYKENKKIIQAFLLVSFDKKTNRKISSREYNFLKEINAQIIAERNTKYKKGKTYEEQMIRIYGYEEGIKRAIEYKNKIKEATSNENNPMYQKNMYDVWIEKYGKEIADEKYKQWRNNVLLKWQKYTHPFKDKNHTIESKDKNRKAHLGKHHSDETKKLFSLQRSGKNNPMFGKHPVSPMKGRHHSDETKKLLREKRLKYLKTV